MGQRGCTSKLAPPEGWCCKGEHMVMVLWEGVQSFYLFWGGLFLRYLFLEEEKVDAQSAAQRVEAG